MDARESIRSGDRCSSSLGEGNLKKYIRLSEKTDINRPSDCPQPLQISIQDILDDGSCPRVRRLGWHDHSSTEDLTRRTEAFSTHQKLLSDCPQNLRCRFVIVCPEVRRCHRLMPLHGYLAKLLAAVFPIQPAEFWSVIERSPAWQEWLEDMDMRRGAEIEFERCTPASLSQDRLHDLGSLCFLDLGQVPLGKFSFIIGL